jgi:hypothetical protein
LPGFIVTAETPQGNKIRREALWKRKEKADNGETCGGSMIDDKLVPAKKGETSLGAGGFCC